MTRPLVSIVTPSYNQASYLEETLRSVLEQDYPRIEYLVVDDGSTDGSLEILERYADRVSLTVQENRGQARTLNEAFARTSGAFLGALSSDDTLLPGTVSRIVASFEREPELLLVYGDALQTDEESRRAGYIEALAWDVARMARTGRQAPPQPSAFWSRRAWELAGPFNEHAWALFDTEFFLRLGTVGQARRLRQPLATVRLHPGSKTMSQHRRMGAECVRFADEFFGDGVPEALAPFARAGQAAFYRRAALSLYAAGDAAAARRLFLRSLIRSPRGLTRKQLSRLARAFVPGPILRRRRARRAAAPSG
jgi:glycosyltransferase involved in cell wall biosynthesis